MGAGHCLKVVFSVLVGILAVVSPLKAPKKNACTSFADYFVIDQSQNCWYNPDVDADIFEIVARRNISMEMHHVETPDGYILTSFRLPQKDPKGVVYLVHPVTQTSIIWFNDERSALGFLLHYAGYEVWLSNIRGSYYSRGHRKLSTDDSNYWNFTFHEMGVYDIPTELDMIKNVSKTSDIIYVGYSAAASSATAYASLSPEHAAKSVKLFVFLAPVIYTEFSLLEELHITNLDKVLDFLEFTRLETVSGPFSITQMLWKTFCDTKLLKFLCYLPLEGMDGIRNFDPVKVGFTNRNFLTKIPFKVLKHYYQIYKRSRFQQFDYGQKGNIVAYNSSQPPVYPIENINVPIYIIHGGKDKVSTVANVERFYGELSHKAKLSPKKLIPEFNHFDFIFGRQYKEYVSDVVLDVIKRT